MGDPDEVTHEVRLKAGDFFYDLCEDLFQAGVEAAHAGFGGSPSRARSKRQEEGGEERFRFLAGG